MHEITVAFYANLEQLTTLGSFTLLEVFVVFLKCARNKRRKREGGEKRFAGIQVPLIATSNNF